MVKKMNKTQFINVLEEKTKLSNEKCIIVNDVLENHFLIGKRNKEKIINDLIKNLSLDYSEAENIYNIAINIISSQIKNKMKNPFKSQD